MGMLTNIPTWSFGGTTFRRRISGGEWPRWFKRGTIHTISPLIGGGRHTDVGGDDYEPLPITAAFETNAARQALLAKRGTTATLINISGTSITALLVDAVETDVGSNGLFLLECTFEVA